MTRIVTIDKTALARVRGGLVTMHESHINEILVYWAQGNKAGLVR